MRIDEVIKQVELTIEENDRFLKHLIIIRDTLVQRRTELARIKRELSEIKEASEKTPVEPIQLRKASQNFQAVGRILDNGDEKEKK